MKMYKYYKTDQTNKWLKTTCYHNRLQIAKSDIAAEHSSNGNTCGKTLRHVNTKNICM